MAQLSSEIAFAYITGMRRGEIAALPLAEVNGAEVVLAAADSKNAHAELRQNSNQCNACTVAVSEIVHEILKLS